MSQRGTKKKENHLKDDVLGNIELNDPGEEEEEDENGEGVSSQEEGVSSQEEGVSSQEEEDESLAEQPEEMDWDLDIQISCLANISQSNLCKYKWNISSTEQYSNFAPKNCIQQGR